MATRCDSFEKHFFSKLCSEGLFTLDNRRLYALQRAAVAQYPRSYWVRLHLHGISYL